MGFFKNLFSRKEEAVTPKPAAPEKKRPAPQSETPKPKPASDSAARSAAASPASTPVPAPAPAPKPAVADSGKSVEEIKDVLNTINNVFAEEERENLVIIPGEAMLKMVPPENRGPNWDEDNFPGDCELQLDKEDVIAQLKTGRISYPAADLAPVVPDGWLVFDDKTMLDLDLSIVVAAIPPDQLRGASQKSQNFQAVEGMRSLFKPKRKPSGAIKKQEVDGGASLPEPATAAPQPVSAPEPEPLIQPAPAPEPETVIQPAPAPEPETVIQPALIPDEPEVVEDIEEEAIVQPVAAMEPEPEPEVESEPEPEPETAVQPVSSSALTPYSEKDYAPVDWSGIDDASAVGGVNINTASIEELEVLPGVGRSRAQDIITIRERLGGFKHIYELSKVPGIGTKLFKQMTGLSLTSGQSRHQVLNKLLDLPAEATPSLAAICIALCDRTNSKGCVLSTTDGVPLAYTPSASDVADRYAAISSQLFRRTGRYLRNLTGNDVDCLSLPMADQPILLFTKNGFFFVIIQDEKHSSVRDTKRANAILEEISWLLGKRAIVRGM
ncbi:MAG: helix-hairpin-helix domain-containing protein [Lentisphaeria bacterium]|nr:helix-hairpin-helix domain-containing protein [Lentisphaeria bacterium]